ncbi:lytic cellulose monooxygenase (C1-hydroxylating) [Alternaria panax]|uniref:AA9 family lytic polysaccharide monooxygenase n=1 Tax=Alternaria panax TaxID=48097 RepID=A0AAD4NPF8_9PLEO|nr:lytic cellulose monooxygenase (C1-hydroxylating) [Alternaria panax]
MKASIFALALAGAASAHTTVYSISVNGKTQGLGNVQGGYIDSPPNNNPVVDITSKAMECNVANIKASKSVAVNGGDKIAVEWHHDSADASDDIIDPSHKGPISVYMSKAGSSMSWTKIAEDGYDGKSWAVEKLIKGAYTGKPGQHEFTLPNVAPGEYIIRPEIIALHEGDRIGGAQFYQECIHVKVGGSGTTALPAGVAIPGHLSAQDPGVHFNLYGSYSSYPLPGPKLWNGAGAAAPAKPAAPAAPAKPAAPAAPAKPAAPTTTKVAAPAPTKVATPAKTTLATIAKPAPTAGGATAQKYGQCGGNGFTGATACASGSKCVKQNDWYSQCL